MDWIVGKIGWERYIMWLYGPAGAGKSAIAQTIAELCRALGILLASFFFSRSDPKRNNVRTLAASLAYQLAVSLPEARSLIENVVENDPAMFQQSLQAQFKALIVDPLMHINRLGIPTGAIPYVIMVDGLDECAGANVQHHILETTAALSSYKDSIHLMFMFSSRAEQEISLTFSNSALEEVMTRIALDDTYQSEADIRKYLEGSFSEMKKTHLQKSLIPPTWPEANDISLLVDKSSGQFIYAATVIRYISSSRYTPMSSLEMILGLRSIRGGAPFAELDALYRDILSRVEDKKATLQLLGAVTHLRGGNSPLLLEEFLTLADGDVARLLADVSSLVTVELNRIRFLHASFGDFLSDPDRSKEYNINPATTCTELAFVGLRHVERYNVGMGAYRLAWQPINLLKDLLLCANPTDELRERFFRAPFLEFLFTSLNSDIGIINFQVAVNELFLVLKTSRFSNTDVLYLHHREAWGEILRKHLVQIEFDAVMAAIVAFTHTDLDINILCKILEAKFGLERKVLLGQQVSDKGIRLHTTTIFCIQPVQPSDSYDEYQNLTHSDPLDEYRNLVLGFLRDPLRAGKYLVDGEKMAILALILLEALIWP
ncbi:hypothetical protein GALMADRAFT_144814 [Galerina marginata CBS 339.88]|uniref:Nephrocystin 3-like N-terminal domain-containing protein n=1 Tax=Galerina marginata (strain CBS 339.88) TaxID=685588 RepID=A0A067SGT9_GALM3|nr:hypothetical protein GALMADRAFT_144814 [Galerina marginata CBS 339.88]